MKRRITEFIFFGNYYYVLCVLALSVESSLQQSLGLNSPAFYLLLTSATILYYTYAYRGVKSRARTTPPARPERPKRFTGTPNERTQWYRHNRRLILITQIIFAIVFIISVAEEGALLVERLALLNISEWFVLITVPAVALLYYGGSWFRALAVSLRGRGWIKPFAVGYVWAGTVTLLPALFYHWEHGQPYYLTLMGFWLFLKNWMFISVLAIMFDIKDYADDANRQLKTFVVRVGLRRTIFLILLPLITAGLLSFSIFAFEADFSAGQYLINLIPFVSLLLVAYSLHRRRPILYYLIVIDGLMLLKGICGSLAALIFS